MKAIEIQKELETYIDPVKREYLPGFFKTGKGQYGEGDRFLGIVVPATRLVAKKYKNAPFEVMAELLQSEWHECRLCALLMMVERFKKSGGRGAEVVYGAMIRIERRRNGLSEPEVRPVCNENVRQKNHWLELLPGENRWKTLYGI